MTDKQLALESIQRLPDDTSLEAIAERLRFMAGVHKGSEAVERGEVVSHEEVKRQLATWLKNNRQRSDLKERGIHAASTRNIKRVGNIRTDWLVNGEAA